MELRLYLLEVVNATADRQQSIYFGVAALLIVVLLALALIPLAPNFMLPATRAFALVGRPSMFYAAATLLIAWLRLPGLLSGQLNPDEGQFTAAAARLLVDPVFWRSVDTGSSGPMNIYPLTLPHLFGWFPDFASSRLIGLLLLIGSVLLLHATLACKYSDASARLALIPVVFTVGFFQDNDYVHYSSEHGPIFLLSISLYLICRISLQDISRQLWLPMLAGFTLGMMPYTKMQGVPMAAVLVLVFFHLLWVNYRSRSKFAGGAFVCFAVGLLLPTAIAFVLIDRFQLWQLVWESYIQTNLLIYADWADIGVLNKVETFFLLLKDSLREFYPLLAATAFVAGFYVMNVFYLRKTAVEVFRNPPSLGVYAILYLVAAAYAIGRPGNSFLHYTLLLLPPLGLLLGTIIGEIQHQLQKVGRFQIAGPSIRWTFVISVLALISVSRPIEVYRVGNPYLRDASEFLENYRGSVATAILEVAQAGSTMTIWGWSPELYVETGLTQATRYGNTFWQAEQSPLQEQFMGKFVRELETARPGVFVDAMSPSMFYYWTVARADRAKRRHEAYPALSAVVSANYEFVREVRGTRIYRLKSQL